MYIFVCVCVYMCAHPLHIFQLNVKQFQGTIYAWKMIVDIKFETKDHTLGCQIKFQMFLYNNNAF